MDSTLDFYSLFCLFIYLFSFHIFWVFCFVLFLEDTRQWAALTRIFFSLQTIWRTSIFRFANACTDWSRRSRATEGIIHLALRKQDQDPSVLNRGKCVALISRTTAAIAQHRCIAKHTHTEASKQCHLVADSCSRNDTLVSKTEHGGAAFCVREPYRRTACWLVCGDARVDASKRWLLLFGFFARSRRCVDCSDYSFHSLYPSFIVRFFY